jgi:hypothetical protein
MQIDLLPDLARHIILEYLNYKLRCGKYIKQLPKDLPIYQCILNRPQVEEKSYYRYRPDELVYDYNKDDGTYYDYNEDDEYDEDDEDEDNVKKYFLLSLEIKYFKRKCWLANTLVISYSYNDRNVFKVESQLYEYDYDGTKHRVD